MRMPSTQVAEGIYSFTTKSYGYGYPRSGRKVLAADRGRSSSRGRSPEVEALTEELNRALERELQVRFEVENSKAKTT